MEQLARINEMENALDQSKSAFQSVFSALDRLEEALPALENLESYYSGPLWMQDFEDDEAGRLPDALKRGVLSEDAVFDLLSDAPRLLERLRRASDALESSLSVHC